MTDRPRVEVLHRGRFHPAPDAAARRIAANAWEIRIPVPSALHAFTRRRPDLEAWDGAIFCVDGVELEPCVGSGADGTGVSVTALDLTSPRRSGRSPPR